MRLDERNADQLRDIRITPNWQNAGEGNCLIEFGNTKVLCTATFTEGVPRWKKDSGEGWVTAEYAMLPRATDSRSTRESVKGKLGGRTHEISRLVGRSLRAVVDMKKLGENQIIVDCDVLQADGGTRTASITGAYVAMQLAADWAVKNGILNQSPIIDSVAAISVGIVDGQALLDLPYEEDVRAETDMNVVITGSGTFVEVQGTAEHGTFDRDQLNELLDLAEKGTRELATLQTEALA